MSIVSQEKDTYETMWQISSYSEVTVTPATVGLFAEMTGAKPGSHILDAGCGTGQGGLLLRSLGYSVTLLDFTDTGLSDPAKGLPFRNACLWDDLRPELKVKNLYDTYDKFPGAYDWVFCTDVLEHIPSEYTMLVLHRLMEACKVGMFLTISLIPDNQGVWVGKPLHQTVQPFTWWRDRLKTFGTVRECRDMIIKGAYYVTRD